MAKPVSKFETNEAEKKGCWIGEKNKCVKNEDPLFFLLVKAGLSLH